MSDDEEDPLNGVSNTRDYQVLYQALLKGNPEEQQFVRLAIADYLEEQGEVNLAGLWRKAYRRAEAQPTRRVFHLE